MNSSTAAPAAKVLAGGVAGAIVTIIVWLVSAFGHVDMPAEVSAALVVIIGFAASYLTPPAARDVPVPGPEKPL